MRLIALLLFCLWCAAAGWLISDWYDHRHQPIQHSIAYCHTNKTGIAYPCRENPYWRAKI